MIGLVALLGHGLLLFNDGIYFDDWILQPMLAESNWSELQSWFSQMGLPFPPYIYWGVKLAGGYYQAVALLAKFFSAVLIYNICLRFSWVNRYEALGIALLSLVYPAYQVAATFCNLTYEFYYCLFLLAAWLLLRTEQIKDHNGLGLLARLPPLLLFFIAFNLNSLLVFYFSFLLLLFLYLKQARQISWLAAAKTWLPRYADFILLPFAYWIGKKVFFPTHGLYANYNVIKLNLASIADNLLTFIMTAGYAQVEASVARLMGQPILWFLILVGIYLAYAKFMRKKDSLALSHFQIEQLSRKTKWIFLYGGGLLLSGIFAYSAVGLSPTLSGWNTRHAILVGLPMAILIVAALRPIWINGLYHETGSFDSRVVSVLIGGSLLVAFTLSTISYYVGWQARAIKDRAIMTILAEAPVLKNFSVFWIDDQFPAGGERAYRFYEWSGMFKQVWGGESRIGLQMQVYGNNPAILPGFKQYSTKFYTLSEFDPSGCQVKIGITRGSMQYSDAELVRQYFKQRFFNKTGLADFLHGVVHLDVQFLPSEDKRCFVDIGKK
ncbi:MAG: hypothetical protein WC091_00040 [Sulfuricellaceae bacterium]